MEMCHNFLFTVRTGLESAGLKCGVRKTFIRWIWNTIQELLAALCLFLACLSRYVFFDTLLDAKATKRGVLIILYCAPSLHEFFSWVKEDPLNPN